ncbi:aminomethyltransferase [Roseivirga thermotolerans]|uniref:Aminomethyltransferase n=2 Tax=Roseivirga thermotolerans TaxID=1758176 RepID=A0ABQ3I8L1_9BACT|nr:aminomethyltransferase [Roseivirga thermotolerans]
MLTFVEQNEIEMELKKVALNDLHESLGAKMVPFAGYNMPVRYTSDIEEHNTVRNGVGVFDVSHMGEFVLEGPDALDLIQRVTSNDASKLVDGQAQYSYLPNDKGGIVDDLLVYRFNEQKYMLVVNASNIEKDWEWISRFNHKGVSMRNVSDSHSLFAVQGPKAVATLQKLTSVDLSSIKFYNFVVGPMAGVEYVIISATGYTGAGGFEIYVHNDHAESVWKQIFEAGAEFDIKPIGLGARDTLRLEMGYCLYGNDITDETSPIAAGLGWVTKFTKEFTNSEAIQKQKEEGVPTRLIAFKMIDKGIPRSHYELMDAEENVIGEVTSGSMSPTLGIGIGLGYVKKEFSKAGTEIHVAVRNRRLKAEVVKLPFVQK